MNEPLPRELPTDEELERTTIAPTMIAFGVAIIGLLVGFVALGSEHLYIGSIAIIVAVVAAAMGSLWLIDRMLHNRRLQQRRSDER